MVVNDEISFFLSEVPLLEVGSQVIHPSQSATFTTPKQTCANNINPLIIRIQEKTQIFRY